MMLALTILFPTLALPAVSAQTMYRYVDPTGRVVYSDRPPPPSAKDTTQRSLSANVIDTDALPFATRDAMKRNPVTLYTFDCGDVCRDAEALLAKRGVPHSVVLVTRADGVAKLKALTGGESAPVLQVGTSGVAIGYNEAQWQSMLDAAGYPKSAPPLRATAPAASGEGAPAPSRAGAPPTVASPAIAPSAGAAPAAASSGPGTGYPQ
ncbi:MAG: DUF4124 domain-containing protein [Proteobacteria bacterium]|nr:DUF4124 domain-containing protein [Pseudomonadota bacterium]